MGQLLSKAAILAATDLVTEDVDVPEWGGTVRVRTMTGTQRDAFGAAIAADQKANGDKPSSFSAALVAACLIGEDGEPLFSGDDITALAGKSAAALERVAKVAGRLNGIGAAAVETAEGN